MQGNILVGVLPMKMIAEEHCSAIGWRLEESQLRFCSMDAGVETLERLCEPIGDLDDVGCGDGEEVSANVAKGRVEIDLRKPLIDKIWDQDRMKGKEISGWRHLPQGGCGSFGEAERAEEGSDGNRWAGLPGLVEVGLKMGKLGMELGCHLLAQSAIRAKLIGPEKLNELKSPVEENKEI
nr:hypothetical protein Iba_chr12fCG8150 [Ipomoea batatas]